MNYNNPIPVNHFESTSKVYEKHFKFQTNNFMNKRKSDEICFKTCKDKINKIPLLQRMNNHDKNDIIQTIVENNNVSSNEKPVRDKNCCLHILKNIYLNDSHLANNNLVRSSLKESCGLGVSKKFEKRKTYNFNTKNTKIKENCQKKYSRKKLSCCTNSMKNNCRKKSSVSFNEVQTHSNKNSNNYIKLSSNTNNNKFKRELISRCKSSRAIRKFSANNSSIPKIVKYKSSKNLTKNKDLDIDNMKCEEKNDKEKNIIKQKEKETKKENNIKKKKQKRKHVHDTNKNLNELFNSETKNNSNQNNLKNMIILETDVCKDTKNYKYANFIKKLKSNFLCCFNAKEDSFLKD